MRTQSPISSCVSYIDKKNDGCDDDLFSLPRLNDVVKSLSIYVSWRCCCCQLFCFCHHCVSLLYLSLVFSGPVHTNANYMWLCVCLCVCACVRCVLILIIPQAEFIKHKIFSLSRSLPFSFALALSLFYLLLCVCWCFILLFSQSNYILYCIFMQCVSVAVWKNGTNNNDDYDDYTATTTTSTRTTS